MRFKNYFSKFILIFKTLPKIRLYPVIVSVTGVLLCSLKFFSQTRLSYHTQLFSVFTVILGIIYILQSKYSMIQIPAFKYNLKLLSEFNLKGYVFCKVSFFSFAFIYIILSLFNFDTSTDFIVSLFLNLSMLICLSRRPTLKETTILFLYSSLIFLSVDYIILWTLYGIVYLFTNLFPLNYKQMYVDSLLYNEALSTQGSTTYKLQEANSRLLFPQMYVNSLFRFYILKIANLTKLLFYIIFANLMVITFVYVTGLNNYLKEVSTILYVISLTTLIDIITIEDNKVLKAKTLSAKLRSRVLIANYFLFIIVSGILFVFLNTITLLKEIPSFSGLNILIFIASVIYLIIKHVLISKNSILRENKYINILGDIVFYIFISLYIYIFIYLVSVNCKDKSK